MSNIKPTKVLYVSHDGILEPLGESQVLCYIERLTSEYKITLLSYEKRNSLRDERRYTEMKSRLQHATIEWIPLRYHRWPPGLATVYDIIRGIFYAVGWCLSNKGAIIHARSYVASLIALSCKRILPVKFIFDMRGFWPDERADAGHWSKSSLVYKAAKYCERLFFESADTIVSLTHAGINEFPRLGYRIRPLIAPVVIPTCTDLRKFCPGSKDPSLLETLSLENYFVVGCSGTMSGWYLRKEMLAFLAYVIKNIKQSKLLLISQENRKELQNDAERAGIDTNDLTVIQATFDEMPQLMRVIDVGVFFIRECFSKKASCATKLGEFLGTGLPVIINDGIGDTGDIVRDHDVGVVLSDFEPIDFAKSVEKLSLLRQDPSLRRRCRETAAQYFDLNTGVRNYASIYKCLSSKSVVQARYQD